PPLRVASGSPYLHNGMCSDRRVHIEPSGGDPRPEWPPSSSACLGTPIGSDGWGGEYDPHAGPRPPQRAWADADPRWWSTKSATWWPSCWPATRSMMVCCPAKIRLRVASLAAAWKLPKVRVTPGSASELTVSRWWSP